eukprot:c47597_g1_i1 orf=80-793(+)
MEWSRICLDAIPVVSGVVAYVGYHASLYVKVRRNPMQTVCGRNQRGRRLWVHHIMKDNDKKNVLAVQTLRNSIMESTIMATASILLSAGLAAYMTYTSDLKQLLDYGIHKQSYQSIKLFSTLICFFLSFICQTQSIWFINQVNYLINIPLQEELPDLATDYLPDMLDTATIYYTLGTRFFFFSFPLLLWSFGSIPMFVCSTAMVNIFYKLDFVKGNGAYPAKVSQQQDSNTTVAQMC